MKRALSVCCLLLTLAACRSHRGPESTQENFGVSMARMDLWREALFRFKRAVELNPNDAEAHNNLAVAYEANGDFDAAAKEYREAMRLDKSNQYIQKNYSRLVEFTSRNKKRQRPALAPASRTGATDAPAAPPATSTAPATAGGTTAAAPPTSEGPAVVKEGTPPPGEAAPTAAKPAAVPPAATPPAPEPAPSGTAPPTPPPPKGDF